MMQRYATLALRMGLVFVFGWFGIDKFIRPEVWFNWVPPFIATLIPVSPQITMYVLGGVETLIALFLLLGLFTRTIAWIAAVLLVGVIISTGFNDIAVRDLGILAGALSLAFSGASFLSLDNLIRNHREEDFGPKEKLL